MVLPSGLNARPVGELAATVPTTVLVAASITHTALAAVWLTYTYLLSGLTATLVGPVTPVMVSLTVLVERSITDTVSAPRLVT